MKVYSIILAGGKGTRLWPISREEYPKQFCRILERSLFSMTVERALMFSSPEEILIVTNRAHEVLVKREIEDMGVEIPEENILLEPEMRSTLPAIYYAALEIERREGDATVAVLPSDHYLEANENYRRAFEEAFKAAKNHIVTFGIIPRRAHTGYGYIKPGERIESFENVFRVEKFVEKPDEERAKKYVEEGYLWNSGMFAFTLESLKEECKAHQSEIAESLERDGENAYCRLPSLSFDHGIMERTRRAVVVKLDVLWSDLGSFDSLYEILPKDEDENAVRGELLKIDSKRNLVHSETGRLIALVDVDDLIVADLPDALLICRRGAGERIREVVNILSERGDERARIPPTVERPWGSFTVLSESEEFKIKKIVVKPGKRLSLQRHNRRCEHWMVVKGTAKVRVGDEEKILRPGEHVFIPLREIHRLENPGDEELEIIEVQLGDYFGEDDIERIEDDFGRK
ncbi:MAG: mannose-phosphate guanylyltransferase / mannose-6-phosphate isomerase [Archaeoglobi archaeon]|nr:mannose-phosphate guanylyltransferase / mannose-6-phosphate isomerase [Archaeoglobi archaeon]